ncbi:energy-coupling factor transporter ATPase [Bacillus sp. PS06]|uniref:energy-coupling factor transporter ATPase n=1 Tax=Bacillus sp. PS06 TaxID=2764176 RepID=UPI00178136AF|nr:energy-coupling factor transporter ATPase [Bacillus sp. PS06]MBD8071439.1 energy-coupling factor transporter ATPase [Bacillus sp. PS06]
MVTPIVEVEAITFKYDHRVESDVLTDVSFTVAKGEWLAIVGHNGSGKSTLARLLVGIVDAQQGQIRIAGHVLNEQSKWDIRQHIGMVFQNPDNQFIGTTVQDDVAFGLENINMPYQEMKKRVDEALEAVNLTSLRLHDPSRLSGGQKQRVALAGILALRPSILVLDEAFVMLDPKSRRDLLETLQQLRRAHNLTILSITHDMNEAAVSDRVLMLNTGRIERCGSPSEVFSYELELMPPLTERLRRELKERNRRVPDFYMTEDEMVQWLWK